MTTQSQALSVFNFQSTTIRVVADDKGEPLFVASDVCEVLGYRNTSKAIADHCRQKGITKRYTLTEKGEQELLYIDEGNLYRLIIKSRKPEAEPFESWVCDEVLPSIRKTGKYEQPEPVKNPRLLLRNTIHAVAKGDRQTYSNLYNRLYRKFQVTSYKELNDTQCVAAAEFIKSVQGEYISRDKIETPKPSLALCDGQHYVVAKDGVPLMHKVLSHDINDSCLKTMGIGQDKFTALAKDLEHLFAPMNNQLEMNYQDVQNALSRLSGIIIALERQGLPLSGMYQQTGFIKNFLTSYYSRLEAIHFQICSISKNMSLEAIAYASDICRHPTLSGYYGAKIA